MKEYFLPLHAIETVAEDTCAFWLEMTGSDFSFVAGQYAAFTVGSETKVFTLASSPHHRDAVCFVTRMRPSPFKDDLRKIELGTPIQVSPPRGRFVLPPAADRLLLLLAGGIGVTPFHSMIEWSTHERKGYRITLFYSNRTLALTAFFREFQDWAGKNPNFQFVPTLTRDRPADWKYETGRVTPAMMQKYTPDLQTSLYYIAGPPAMVEAMRQTLLAADIPGDQIRIEKFSGY